MSTILKIFESFVGNWEINRILGHQGSATGLASFMFTKDNTLKYHEILRISLKNTPDTFSGYKTYIYEYKNEHIIKKFYENPLRLFYQLTFSKDYTKASGSHLCKADQYDAAYLFKDKNHFMLSYQVTGPHKNYVITSHFVKIVEKPVIK